MSSTIEKPGVRVVIIAFRSINRFLFSPSLHVKTSDDYPARCSHRRTAKGQRREERELYSRKIMK